MLATVLHFCLLATQHLLDCHVLDIDVHIIMFSESMLFFPGFIIMGSIMDERKRQALIEWVRSRYIGLLCVLFVALTLIS